MFASKESISTINWQVLPFTNNMILGSSSRLRLVNFLDSSEVWSININGSTKGICIMNGEEMLIGMGQSLKLVDIRQGDIKSSQPLNRSPLYIVSLAGLGSAYASEVAISMPMAVLDIYIYSQISFGVVRSFKKIHGFYESRSLSPISNTKYVISVANNQSVIIFDIVTPSSNPEIIAFDSSFPYSSQKIEYLKNTNSFYVSYSGGDYTQDGLHVTRVVKMTFCKDPYCIQCSPRDHCEKCGIGFFLSDIYPNNSCMDCTNPVIS